MEQDRFVEYYGSPEWYCDWDEPDGVVGEEPTYEDWLWFITNVEPQPMEDPT